MAANTGEEEIRAGNGNIAGPPGLVLVYVIMSPKVSTKHTLGSALFWNHGLILILELGLG